MSTPFCISQIFMFDLFILNFASIEYFLFFVYISIINLSLTSPHFLYCPFLSQYPCFLNIFHPQILPLNSFIITFISIHSHVYPFVYFPFLCLFFFFCAALSNFLIFSPLNNNWSGKTTEEICKEEFTFDLFFNVLSTWA